MVKGISLANEAVVNFNMGLVYCACVTMQTHMNLLLSKVT